VIAKGTPHRNGVILARYLVTGKEHERAELWELRGFPCTGIDSAFRSVHVMAAATKCLAPFFHVSVRNADGDSLDRSQWEVVANSVERMLGLTDQPRAVAFHIAPDTGHTHMHIAWSRINQDTLTAKPLPFFKQRLKQVCRELEERFGLTPVPNERRSSIRFAPTRAEEEQARRLRMDIHTLRESIGNCYKQSDCGRSFRDALSREGLLLARGDRRDFLVMDGAGGIHALGKRILGVPAAEIRHRLADLSSDRLPTLEQAREFIAAMKPVALGNNVNHHASHAKDAPKPPARERKRTRYGAAERGRAEGKDQPRDQVPMLPVRAHDADPLDHLPMDPLRPGSSLESENAPIDQPRNKTPDPDGDAGQNPELLHVITGPPEQTGRAASRDETAGRPASEALAVLKQPLPAHTPPGHSARLRDQFRALVKQLTAKVLAPRPTPRKRRREEIGGAFRKAALGMLRGIARIPPLHFLDPTWEAFTWLHLWEYNSRASTDFHQSHSASFPPQNPAMRL
jgi:hypothetical protein